MGSGKAIEESMGIGLFLGEGIEPGIKEGGSRTGPRCLGDRAEVLINEEVRGLAKTLLDLEKGEQNQEDKEGLKLAAFVVNEALELLGKGDGVDRECGRWHHSYRSYYYNLYPKDLKNYRPLIERETISNILDKNLLSPEIVKRTENIVNFLGPGGGTNACFISSDGEVVDIRFEEIEEKVKREGKIVYLKLLSDSLGKMFRDLVDRSRKARGDDHKMEKEGLKEVDEFSTFLSGAILSTLKKFPVNDRDINLVLERIYFYVFQAISASLYSYYIRYVGASAGVWTRNDRKSILDFKGLLHSSSGVLINLGRIVEEIEVIVTHEYRKENEETPRKRVRIEKKVHLGKEYTEKGVNLYINSGVDGKIVEIGWLLDKFDQE